jgi:CDP-6-deoxy-D-xylo-4-hexulose-3-dehydrase
MVKSAQADTNLRVPYAQSVYDDVEKKRVLAVIDEHRTNMGIETAEFEKKVAQAFGKKFGIMVNSGSSANLLAFELLDLPQGSEVITPILTFSTTIAPLLQKGLVPVFADVEEGKYFINVDQIEKLITKKTKAMIIPLLLGNVPDIEKLATIAKKHNLYLVDDSCDTFGATYARKPVSSYTDITTTSFFGSHIVTAGGNGGMVMVNKKKWDDRAKVLRGWGRSSALLGETEDISKRFNIKVENIPYDAKFIFNEVGYNFLPNEMCAAFGNAQLEKLPLFRKRRESNFKKLLTYFNIHRKYFILPIQDRDVETQWLAFPLTIRENAPFSRIEITKYLENNNIQTRVIFTGNILKQPGFTDINHKGLKAGYPIADAVMKRGFLIGCHHGLEQKHIDKLTNVLSQFLDKYK